jgi:hypothetical protein
MRHSLRLVRLYRRPRRSYLNDIDLGLHRGLLSLQAVRKGFHQSPVPNPTGGPASIEQSLLLVLEAAKKHKPSSSLTEAKGAWLFYHDTLDDGEGQDWASASPAVGARPAILIGAKYPAFRR